MSSNPKFFLLLGMISLFLFFFAELMISDSHIHPSSALDKASSDWGVETGDVLSFTIQIKLDGKDFLQDIMYRDPLVAKFMVGTIPYVPPYAASQENQTFLTYPQIIPLGYFRGNLKSSQVDLSALLPEFDAIAIHHYYLEGIVVTHPISLDYYAKNYRSGTIVRQVNAETGEIAEDKIEYTSSYLRLTYTREMPAYYAFYKISIGFSRQNGILRDFQIDMRRNYSPEEVEGTEISPGLHRTEEQIEFLKKDSSGYIHSGSSDIEPLFLLAILGLAFGLGTITGIRMRRFHAQKNS